MQAPKDIVESLDLSACNSPQSPALIQNKEMVSFEEFSRRTRCTASALRKQGVNQGTRVLVFLDKTFDLPIALFGIWRAGGVAVQINTSLKQQQIDHIARHSQATHIISNGRRWQDVHQWQQQLIAVDTENLNLETSSFSTNDAIPSAMAAILYTSGSTGMPKGIMLSHTNLVAGARIVSTYLQISNQDRILSVLPFTFDYGLNQLLSCVYRGASIVLQRSTLAADVCRNLQEYDITGLAGVPPLWIQLLDPTSPLRNATLPKLRYITNSGGAMPVDVVKEYRAMFPHTQIFLMYGLTEAFRSTYLPPEKVDVIPTSMGKAIPETEIFVLKDDLALCAPGEIGQLVHRGPTVAMGYLDDKETTDKRFKPDPLDPTRTEKVVFSGDLVRTDDDGFLYFVGRNDEQIKSFGYRISPSEVEESIRRSGLVADVVVKSTPDRVAGSIIIAHCVPKSSATFNEQALTAYCQAAMPNYMVPRIIKTHDVFPKTSSGKIDRKSIE